MQDVIAIYRYLPRSQKFKSGILLAALLFAAILEIAGVMSVMPFLAVLGNPELVEKYQPLRAVYVFLGATSFQQFGVYLALISFFAIVISAAFKIFVQFMAQGFAQEVSGWVSATLFDAYLHQPYAFFLTRNSSHMTQNILSETANAVAHVVHPALMICAHSIVLILLFGALLFIDPAVSIALLVFFTGLYALISFFMAPMLRSFGSKSVLFNEHRYRICAEALNGIKNVKARGLEGLYTGRFTMPSTLYTRYQAYSQVIAQTPRHLVEALGIAAVMAMALYFMKTKDGLGEILPLLGVYVVAGNRLLPAAQQVYQSFAQVRYGMPSLRAVLKDMMLLETREQLGSESDTSETMRPAVIELVDVSFRYPESESDTLKGVSFSIPANSTVGVVGSSGAGKTTLGDILLGLFRPTGGAILVDGVTHDLVMSRSWKRSIGYVPQEVFIIDASIAENIAFGVPKEKIDPEALERAARMANIHEFIINECPDGFETKAGERGVRISGGQRQRLGIARALYSDPQILIFDEATSALDSGTERAIVEAIDGLSHQKTIIMIAHRMRMLKRADNIVFLDKGVVAGVGTFEQLFAKSAEFRTIASHE
jgi:ABC-type multidrug transport system fused ATPase/permease subunit